MHEVQRALGRIEGRLEELQGEVRTGLKDIRQEFSLHKNDDQKNFSSLRNSLKESSIIREQHLATQDAKLEEIALANQDLKTQNEAAKALGKYVLGIFGAAAAIAGTAVFGLFKGHINIH